MTFIKKKCRNWFQLFFLKDQFEDYKIMVEIRFRISVSIFYVRSDWVEVAREFCRLLDHERILHSITSDFHVVWRRDVPTIKI